MPRNMKSLFALVFLPCLSLAFVAGIDFGTEFFKVAIVRIGNPPITIAVNQISSRKTENAVSIRYGMREFGADAVGLSTRFPYLVYEGLNTIIGRTNASIAEFKDAFSPNYELLTDPRRGTILFKDKDNENQTFTTEELYGTILKSAMGIAVANAHESAPIKDCVITVPDFFEQHQRESMVDAARLAGVSVLGLINENTAVALQYGLDRRSQWSADKNFTLVIFNMGSAHTIVTAAQYTVVVDKKNVSSSQVEILAKAYDPTLGGRVFDVALAQHLEKSFIAKSKGKITALNEKAKAKLIKEANRVKEVLTANVDTYASVEALQDEIDFSLHVTRADFDKICEDLYARALKPMQAVLDAIGNKVDAVELFGGGGRITKLGEKMAEILPKDVGFGKHLNGDETAAMGAGFFAAMKSSQFKAKPFKVIDRSAYGIEVRWSGTESADARESTVIFPAGSKATKKVVTVAEADNFIITMGYEAAAQLPIGTHHDIVQFNVTGIKRTLESRNVTSKPKVSVGFRLTESETVQLASAELIFDEDKIVQEEVPANETAAATAAASEDDASADKKDGEEKEGAEGEAKKDGEEGADAKKDGEEGADAKKDGEEGADAKDPDDSSDSKKAKDGKKGKDGKKAKKAEPVYRNVTKTFSRSIELSVVTTRLGIPELSDKEKSQARERLYTMESREEAKRALDASRNGLEAFIYKTKGELEKEGVLGVTTEDQRAEITKAVEEAETWLYGESDDAVVSDFSKRLTKLEKAYAPVAGRLREAEERPKAVSMARQFVNESLHIMKEWPTSKPHLNATEVEVLAEKIKSLGEWLEEKVSAQASLAPHESAAFTSDEVWKKMNVVGDRFKELARKPAPKPKKPASKPKAKKEEKKEEEEKEEKKEEEKEEKKDEEKEEKKDEEKREEEKKEEGEDATVKNEDL